MITYSIRRHYSIAVSPRHVWNCDSKNQLRFQNPLQTYTRWTAPAPVPPSTSVPSPARESSETVTAQLLDNSTTNDLPIALRKGKRTCTQHPLCKFVSYSHLSSSFHSFTSSLDSCSAPKNMSEALSIPCWTQTITTIEHNKTWELGHTSTREESR